MTLAHCGSSARHLVIAVTGQLVLNVCPFAVADLHLASHHSQDEARLVVAPHLLKFSSLHLHSFVDAANLGFQELHATNQSVHQHSSKGLRQQC